MIAAALIVFFLSGTAALFYQVIWQRLLVMFSGADVYSSTIIVAAFMAGLGTGSLAGGYLADRLSRRTSLIVFAVAELAIAAFGVMSRPLYYDILYQRVGPQAVPTGAMAALLFASLLWPTFFMGVSLPMLARALTERLDRAAGVIGALYGANTLGAAAGAFAATWWMLPRFGLDTSLRVAALINVACAVVVLPLSVRLTAQRVTVEAEVSLLPEPTGQPIGSVGLWAIAAAFSGFVALSLEIVWFRLLGVMVKSTAFTFGTLLTIYLASLGAGSLAGSRLAARLRRPAGTFLTLQAAIGLTAAALIGGLVATSGETVWLRAYFERYESLDVRLSVAALRAWLAGSGPATADMWLFLRVYFVVPAMLIVPSTLLMGVSFPVLQRIAQTEFARIGRRVGVLLLANIAGSVAGTVLTGWVLLDTLGTAGTFKFIAALSSVFVVAGLVYVRRLDNRAARAGAPLAAAVLTLAVAVVLPGSATLWSRLHGTSPDRIFYGEDASGFSVLRIERPPDTTVFVNGLGQSTIPYGDIHTALGMLPALLHPNPKRAVVIGLGSGDTVHGVAGRQEIERITAIEIIRPQIETLRGFSARYGYGGVTNLLADRRIEHVAGDGRIYLMHSEREFDIIEADALRPTSAYSGNLYSEEYFRLVRNRLRPGGLAATWSPTVRVHNAFVRVFPYVLSVPGILIGSSTPVIIDRPALAARLADQSVRSHYERAGIDVARMVAEYLAKPAVYTPEFDRATLADVNTDLFPKDEFDLSPWP
jgi:predicted membrane-bound spermidine synthase